MNMYTIFIRLYFTHISTICIPLLKVYRCLDPFWKKIDPVRWHETLETLAPRSTPTPSRKCWVVSMSCALSRSPWARCRCSRRQLHVAPLRGLDEVVPLPWCERWFMISLTVDIRVMFTNLVILGAPHCTRCHDWCSSSTIAVIAK